jgi:hypothetical protein
MTKSEQKLLFLFILKLFLYFSKCSLNPGKKLSIFSKEFREENLHFTEFPNLKQVKIDKLLLFQVGGSTILKILKQLLLRPLGSISSTLYAQLLRW